MAEGWIKLYRKIIDSQLWQELNPTQTKIMITLLLMANSEENTWTWKGESYDLKPGQFITSLPSIQNRCGKGVSIQQIRTTLSKLVKLDFISDESASKNRLITIKKWNEHQDRAYKTNHITNRKLTGCDEVKSSVSEDSNKKDNRNITSNQQDINSNITSNQHEGNTNITSNQHLTRNKNKNKNKNNIYITNKNMIEKFMQAWNDIESDVPDKQRIIPKVRIIKAKSDRDKNLNVLIKEYGLEMVIECIESIKYSSFLRGKTGNGFVITVDWFLEYKNFIKVFEGNYKDRGDIGGQKRTGENTGENEENQQRKGKYEHLYKNI